MSLLWQTTDLQEASGEKRVSMFITQSQPNQPVFSILECKICQEQYAVVPGRFEWLIWYVSDLTSDPCRIAGSLCCLDPMCQGALVVIIDLAVNVNDRWVNVGRNDPVLAENVLMN